MSAEPSERDIRKIDDKARGGDREGRGADPPDAARRARIAEQGDDREDGLGEAGGGHAREPVRAPEAIAGERDEHPTGFGTDAEPFLSRPVQPATSTRTTTQNELRMQLRS